VRAATFQLACVCLGVGIFAMPNVFAGVGLAVGMVMVVGFGLAADLGIQCVLWGADATGRHVRVGWLW
jgi:amino acid permease